MHTHQEFTMSKKHKTYTAEFKAEAIKAIEANQGNVSKTAREIGISIQTLSHWNNNVKAGTLAGTKQYSPDLTLCSKKIGNLNGSLNPLKWNVNF